MKTGKYFCLLACCGLSLLPLKSGADVRDGLVSYWPLDSTDGSTTPDLTPNGNHLGLNGMSSANFVAGIRGNAASFNGTSQYLLGSYSPGVTGLPIYGARYYTIALWVKGLGSSQQARAFFAESSYAAANPLFALRTDPASSGRTNGLAVIVRNDNGNHFYGNVGIASFGDMGKSTLMPLDNNWHHIAWVDNNGVARLYVDGILDPRVWNKTRLPEPMDITARGLSLDTITLGAIYSTTITAFFNGMIDDVGVWDRTLSAAEIDEVRTNGIPTPIVTAASTVPHPPEGNTNLLAGEFFSLEALSSGTYPRVLYQWYKDGSAMTDVVLTNEFGEVIGLPVTGTASKLLSFTNLLTTDSGAYSVVVSNNYGSVTSSVAQLLVSTTSLQAANLTNGQIAYWPLDTVQGITTPDVVRGQDLYLYLLSGANLVSGKWGNAFQFNTNGMLSRLNAPSDALPVSQYRDFTFSAWINAPALATTGNGGQRFFTECRGETGNTTLSLANGDNNTVPRGPWTKARGFFKNDNNQNFADRGASGLDAFYDPSGSPAWHHVVYVQRWVGGASPQLQATWFIDGVKDDPYPVGNTPLSPRVPMMATLTTIGGQWRNGGTDPLGSGGRGFPFMGMIDDVAVWSRALTAEEILMLSTNVVPAAPAVLPALTINTFRGDFPEVVSGDSLKLQWNVAGFTGGGLAISINQGVGNVLARTTNGIGSILVPNITATTTYTLTVQRGTNVLTAQTTATVVSGVAAGWSIIDNFETYLPGSLINPYWADLVGGCQIEETNGNRMLNTPATGTGDGQGAHILLGALNILPGQARTIFTRVLVVDDPALTTMGNIIGPTDKTFKSVAEAQGDSGPLARLNDDSNGDLAVGAFSNILSTVTLIPRKLEQGQVYNLWIDVTNGPFYTNVVDVITNTGDFLSIWIQRLGETGRTRIVNNFMADRDLVPDFLGATLNYLDKVLVGTRTADGALWVDDIYISKTGYNATVPAAWTGPIPPALSVPTLTADTVSSPGQITFSWTAGALMTANSIEGPWTVVPDSYGYTYLATIDPATSQKYFRIQR